MTKWPAHFPAECPFKESWEATGDIYRLVENDPPSPSDFLSLREQNPKRGPYPDPVHECMACGLSVFVKSEDIDLHRQTSKKLRDRKIAKTTLAEVLGRVARTGRTAGHHTWWLPEGSPNPCQSFAVI